MKYINAFILRTNSICENFSKSNSEKIVKQVNIYTPTIYTMVLAK